MPDQNSLILLTDAKKYYKQLPHQKQAVEYLGDLLLKTAAAKKLGLKSAMDWITKNDTELYWLGLQLSKETLTKFGLLYRNDPTTSATELESKYFSQRDNTIKPFVTCNSSAHAMFIDYYLRKNNKPGLKSDEDVLKKVFSGKYGAYGKNPSVSWDIQIKVAKSFGVNCKYSNEGKGALIKVLNEGGICPLNIYHKGSSKSSRGGGHIVVAVDYDKSKGFYIHDPYGNRPPTYNTLQGKYWMSESEFDWRFQGLFTKYLGLI
jgi:hypothetical protein